MGEGAEGDKAREVEPCGHFENFRLYPEERGDIKGL